MNIQKLKIAELNPAKYNPRKDLKEGDPEFEKLKRSIQNYGCVEPIIVNIKNNNTVVGGHQRLKVLQHLGETETECVLVELDDNEEKALNIALNKISGEWDEDKLAKLVAELSSENFDVSLTGLDNAEVTDLVDGTVEVKETPMPEEVERKTKRGQIYKLGNHRLMCGDSTSREDMAKLAGGGGNGLTRYRPTIQRRIQGRSR